jgi:hypothetical protein
MPPRKKTIRRKKATPASVGLTAAETRQTGGPEIDRLAAQVEADGGAVVGRYSDPFGGTPLLIAALLVDRVEPTTYQRDASDAHVKRLMGVIETISRFLDPIVAVREDGQYLTPNGNHRLQALKKLGLALKTSRSPAAARRTKSKIAHHGQTRFDRRPAAHLRAGACLRARPRRRAADARAADARGACR